ncbi:hypothetical protein BC936DRAFT_144724, partial [Jimgerdemannia flammicorona]
MSVSDAQGNEISGPRLSRRPSIVSIFSIPPSYDQVTREGPPDDTADDRIVLEENAFEVQGPEPPPYLIPQDSSPPRHELDAPPPPNTNTSNDSAPPSPPLPASSTTLSLPSDTDPPTSTPFDTDPPTSTPSDPLPLPPIQTSRTDAPPGTLKVISVSGLSQYTTGAASSCIPSCMEACFQVLYGSPLRLTTLDNILKAGSQYRGASHIEASELQSTLKRYRDTIEMVGELHYPIVALGTLVSDLCNEARRQKCPLAAIITKPPESIMIAVHPDAERPIILFDSHPRPRLHPDGAAFVRFPESPVLVTYLRHLFPRPQDLHLKDLDVYTATIMGSVSVLAFKARKGVEGVQTTLDERELMVLEMQYDNFALQQENLRLSEKMESMKKEHQREVADFEEIIRTISDELMAVRLQMEERGGRRRDESYSNNNGRGDEQPRLGFRDRAVQMLWGKPPPESGRSAQSPRQQDFAYSSMERGSMAGSSGEQDFAYSAMEKGSMTGSSGEQDFAHRSQPPSVMAGSFADQNFAHRPQPSSVMAESSGERQQVNSHNEQHRGPTPLRHSHANRPGWVSSYQSDFELAQRLSQEDLALEQLKRDQAVAMRLQEEFALEESRYRTDRSQAESISQNILECPICSDNYPVDDTFHLDSCEHSFCRSCAARYIQNAVESRTFPCLCPCCKAAETSSSSSGAHEIPQQMILSVLSEREQVVWLEMERERGITSDSTVKFVYCRNGKCGKPIEAGVMGETEGLAHVSCPYCNHDWCEKCGLDTWHKGVNCAKYQQWKTDNGKADELTDKIVLEK